MVLLACSSRICAQEPFSALCGDRIAVERVYYDHRLGEKPPFEQSMPLALIDRLVRQEQHKEEVLRRIYGIEITPSLVRTEVERINLTTRAPGVLAEIKAALGNDTNRFARVVARPILVERLLRDKFDNDAVLHAAERRKAESARQCVLVAKHQGQSLSELTVLLKQDGTSQVSKITWHLRGASLKMAPGPDTAGPPKTSGPDDATPPVPPSRASHGRFYLDDLPPTLQTVIRSQLRQPGDVSAVIELDDGFALYVLEEKTAEALRVAALSVPKRNYQQWLAEQSQAQP